MKKEIVTVVYDRRKDVEKFGRGAVEIRIYLGYKYLKELGL